MPSWATMRRSASRCAIRCAIFARPSCRPGCGPIARQPLPHQADLARFPARADRRRLAAGHPAQSGGSAVRCRLGVWQQIEKGQVPVQRGLVGCRRSGHEPLQPAATEPPNSPCMTDAPDDTAKPQFGRQHRQTRTVFDSRRRLWPQQLANQAVPASCRQWLAAGAPVATEEGW